MKGALLTAAVLLGSAQGAVHKMKLQKVPLSEQLVCSVPIFLSPLSVAAADTRRLQEAVPINTQLEQLGQKYMGHRPRQSHAQAVFNGMVAEVKGNHPVPISNFMNAQCTCTR
jgi:saccharopepsin